MKSEPMLLGCLELHCSVPWYIGSRTVLFFSLFGPNFNEHSQKPNYLILKLIIHNAGLSASQGCFRVHIFSSVLCSLGSIYTRCHYLLLLHHIMIPEAGFLPPAMILFSLVSAFLFGVLNAFWPRKVTDFFNWVHG